LLVTHIASVAPRFFPTKSNLQTAFSFLKTMPDYNRNTWQ